MHPCLYRRTDEKRVKPFQKARLVSEVLYCGYSMGWINHLFHTGDRYDINDQEIIISSVKRKL
jgi:hypothetical protein